MPEFLARADQGQISGRNELDLDIICPPGSNAFFYRVGIGAIIRHKPEHRLALTHLNLELADTTDAIEHILNIVGRKWLAAQHYHVVNASHHAGNDDTLRPLGNYCVVTGAVAQQWHHPVEKWRYHQLTATRIVR